MTPDQIRELLELEFCPACKAILHDALARLERKKWPHLGGQLIWESSYE